MSYRGRKYYRLGQSQIVREDTLDRWAREAKEYALAHPRNPQPRRRKSTLVLKTGPQIRAEIAERKRLREVRNAELWGAQR